MYKLFEIGYFSVSLAYTECSDWLSHSQSMSTCSVNFDDRCMYLLCKLDTQRKLIVHIILCGSCSLVRQ